MIAVCMHCAEACFVPAGFSFAPNMNNGYTLRKSDGAVLTMAKQCLADPVCQGFNTLGELKSSGQASTALSPANAQGPCEGLYQKLAPGGESL